jgi:hypothetical protein
MAASTEVVLSKKAQLAFFEYYRNTQNIGSVTRNQTRARFLRVDREYQREVDRQEDNLRAQKANNQGDTSRYQDMTVPVVMPQVEGAVTHQSSVFLTGDPIFGVVASPEFEDEALQLQTILEDNSIKGGWAKELMLFFRDGAKYNFAPVEVSWAQEVTHTVETDLTKNAKEGVPKKVIWSGNKIRRLDPYNTFVDTKVPASEVYKDGEFGGFTELFGRIKLKKFISELPHKIIANIKPAFESGVGGTMAAKDASAMNYYMPSINPAINEDDYKGNGTNWIRWAGITDTQQKIDYKDNYEVTTLYCRILPSEFDLRVPNAKTPQIYKLVFVNHEHIIFAEQQTNAHGYLPLMIGQPLEDGLSYQTKSYAENAIPFQQLATTYMGSIIASARRSISDRTLFDPSRITAANMNSANPSAKIPVRPAAFGSNISDAVYAFPYRADQNAVSMQQIQTILELSDSLAGQNKAQRGQFTKGNRTVEEFSEIMQNANGRDQLASLLIEHQVFVPIKLILKLNTLQFQGGTTVYNRDEDKVVEIDPVALRKAVLNFRISDGVVPASKIISADAFGIALQTMAGSPQIGASYNIGPAFSYLMKTQGAEIAAFEKPPEQVAYEGAMSQWQSIVALAIEKSPTGEIGGDFPPQPLPEQFGYDPAANNPKPEADNSGSQAPTPPSVLEG